MWLQDQRVPSHILDGKPTSMWFPFPTRGSRRSVLRRSHISLACSTPGQFPVDSWPVTSVLSEDEGGCTVPGLLSGRCAGGGGGLPALPTRSRGGSGKGVQLIYFF